MVNENAAGYDVLAALVKGWEFLVVRVRQNGRLEWVPLNKVQDQGILYKIVKRLIKQWLKENGVLD